MISEASDTVTNTITVGRAPEGLAVDPDTGTVYVANSSAGTSTGTVSVISEASGTVTDTISVGAEPEGVAVDPDTGTVYVPNAARRHRVGDQ